MYMIPQNRILEKIIPNGRKNNSEKTFIFFFISKFEESQNISMVSKISIGILFKMVYSIESHRKKKILALNLFFLLTQKKRVDSTKNFYLLSKYPESLA